MTYLGSSDHDKLVVRNSLLLNSLRVSEGWSFKDFVSLHVGQGWDDGGWKASKEEYETLSRILVIS